MKPAAATTIGHCTIVGAGNLPASVGGSKGLCSIIEHAISARAGSVSYTAQISVMPRSRLSAVIVVNGRELPKQNFALMDGELSPAAIKRFADDLASQVADAARGQNRS